jgi:hypothetical protein
VWPGGFATVVFLGLASPFTISALGFLIYFKFPFPILIAFSYIVLIQVPNAMYMALEIKHLILKDGIADDRPWPAVVVFLAISIVGLFCTETTILIAVHWIPVFSQYRFLSIVLCSMLMSVGGVFGLMDFFSFQGYNPIYLIRYTWMFLQDRKMVILAIALTILLSALTVCIDHYL